jgi:predicted metal-dependent peptidase
MGVIFPVLRQPVPKIAIVLDTSGSMGNDLLDSALTEVNGVLKQMSVPSVNVIVADSATHSMKEVTKASQISLEGGGGTDMRVGIQDALRVRPHVIIVLTDGYTPWPDACSSRGVKIIAGLVGKNASEPPTHIQAVWIDEE